MWDRIINIYPSELLSTKIKKSKINESLKNKKKKRKETASQYICIFFKKTIYILYLVRTNFDLNPEQEWTQAQKARTINLLRVGEKASLNLG